MPGVEGLVTGLEVAGDLLVLADDRPVRVAFLGSLIEVEIPDFKTALSLRGAVGRKVRTDWLRRTQAGLARGGLELSVKVAGRRVGRMGAGVRPNLSAAALGLSPMELFPAAVLASALGRPAGPAGTQK